MTERVMRLSRRPVFLNYARPADGHFRAAMVGFFVSRDSRVPETLHWFDMQILLPQGRSRMWLCSMLFQRPAKRSFTTQRVVALDRFQRSAPPQLSMICRVD